VESGIVLELQKQALDEDTSIEELLRKAYLVARKLKLQELQEWISQEQNGYSRKVPDYRYIFGEMKAWNPYNRWIPMIMPAQMADMLSKIPLGMSIASIVDSYESTEKSVVLTVNGELTDALNTITSSLPTKYGFIVSKSELYRVLSTVRNKILDWAIVLEENGIIGEGMTFTESEKNTAISTEVINNYTNNFYGEVKDIDLQQG